MKTFEYKVMLNLNENSLIALGKEGWELVAVLQTSHYRFYLKREIRIGGGRAGCCGK